MDCSRLVNESLCEKDVLVLCVLAGVFVSRRPLTLRQYHLT